MPNNNQQEMSSLKSPAMTPKFDETQLKLLERRLAIRDAEQVQDLELMQKVLNKLDKI